MLKIITIRNSKKEIQDFCKLILRHKLYYKQGMMKSLALDQIHVYDRKRISFIAMAFIGNIPVGALLLGNFYNHDALDIGVYVKTRHRRKGIGRKLFKKAEPFGAKKSFITNSVSRYRSPPHFIGYARRSFAFYEAVGHMDVPELA
jgi:GNAT superfamily N-acetyltransferase